MNVFSNLNNFLCKFYIIFLTIVYIFNREAIIHNNCISLVKDIFKF